MPQPNQATIPSAPSPAVRSILQLKRVYGRRRLKEWSALLAEVGTIDRTSEPLTAPARRKIFAFLFLAAVFAAVVPLFIYVAALSVASAGIAGFFLVRWWRLRSGDLSNDFRNILVKFLRIMAEDIPAKGRISMLLDLSGPTKQKLVKQQQLPPGRYNKIVEKVYADPWCRMQAPLSNGSRMLLAIENRYTVLQRTWTNPRGKTKAKTKWKKLVKVKAGLIPDPERLRFDTDQVAHRSGQENLRLMRKPRGEVCRLTRKFKFKDRQMPEATVSPDELVAMFFVLGSLLKPSTRS